VYARDDNNKKMLFEWVFSYFQMWFVLHEVAGYFLIPAMQGITL